MRFFITGGAGLIGAQVSRQLIESGHHVTIYDAFIRYIAPSSSGISDVFYHRFEGISTKVEFIRGDTAHKSDVSRAITKSKPDVIIHLAAMPIADLAFDHSEEAINSILVGAVNVLEAVRDASFVKRFVYISSSLVYGDFLHVPCEESHPKSPKEIYGSLKLAGETMTRAFGTRYDIEWSIVRPSAVYGPTDQNQRVTEIFLNNAAHGRPVIMHGGGLNTLDFTYVNDIAHGIILAATHPAAAGEDFNITRGEGRTLQDLVKILHRHFPHFSIEAQEQALYRPKRGALSIKKAQKLLGYRPKYSLEDGMERYITFFKEQNSIS